MFSFSSFEHEDVSPHPRRCQSAYPGCDPACERYSWITVHQPRVVLLAFFFLFFFFAFAVGMPVLSPGRVTSTRFSPTELIMNEPDSLPLFSRPRVCALRSVWAGTVNRSRPTSLHASCRSFDVIASFL